MDIMKYMNIRYECPDACDDFAAKCKNETEDNIHYQWITSEMLDDLDEYNNEPYVMILQ